VPRPRFLTADPDLRARLLGSARRELAAKGYEAASLNRILEDAGLSKGAFYYYFDDKADLAVTVLEDAMAPYLAELEAMQPADDVAGFWAEMEAMNARSLARLAEHPDEADLFTRLGVAFREDEALLARVMPLIARQAKSLALWRRGQELGAIRHDLPIEVLVATIQAIKQSLIPLYLPKGAPTTPEALASLAAAQWDMARRILAPVAASSPEQAAAGVAP
jgi:AcrR family transcriptional regulator